MPGRFIRRRCSGFCPQKGAPVKSAGAGDRVEIVRLALRHQLSAYDAAYLAPAISEKLPLAMADKRLAAAARSERMLLIEASGRP